MKKHNWLIKTIGETCDILCGYAFDSKLFTDDKTNIPIIRIRDISRGYTETYYKGEYNPEYIVKNGDYLIGMDGEFNINKWGGNCALLNQRVCKISIKNNILHPAYLLYFMPLPLKKIEDETPFVTVKHLSTKKIATIKIPIPPIKEQEKVICELDRLSKIIDNKKKQLEAYDKLAQSIFYDMFGDPIANEKGWKVKKLGDICKTTSGGTPAKGHSEYYDGGTIPWLRSGEVNKMYISDTELYITDLGLEKSSAKWFPENTVVIAMYGATVGQVGILKKDMTTNQAICGIFPNETFISIYLYYFLLNKKKEYLSLATGGAQPNISQNIVRDTSVCCPPVDIQQLFAEKIEAIENQKNLVKKSLQEVETLFNSRMDYYFN